MIITSIFQTRQLILSVSKALLKFDPERFSTSWISVADLVSQGACKLLDHDIKYELNSKQKNYLSTILNAQENQCSVRYQSHLILQTNTAISNIRNVNNPNTIIVGSSSHSQRPTTPSSK